MGLSEGAVVGGLSEGASPWGAVVVGGCRVSGLSSNRASEPNPNSPVTAEVAHVLLTENGDGEDSASAWKVTLWYAITGLLVVGMFW